MPISLRRAKIRDIRPMQNANLHCLAENYQLWYWLYHYLLSPQGGHVAVDSRGKVVGYVLSRIDDEGRQQKNPPPTHGQVTSVAIYSQYRKLGIATKLLAYTHETLKKCLRAEYVDLNVRETNRAAHVLYKQTLGYKFVKQDEGYYADGENGWSLRYTYPPEPGAEPKKG